MASGAVTVSGAATVLRVGAGPGTASKSGGQWCSEWRRMGRAWVGQNRGGEEEECKPGGVDLVGLG